MSDETFDDDDPKVIAAKADAELKEAQGKALILEARSKLNWSAQLLFVLLDKVEDIIRSVGCILILLIVVFGCLAFFTPDLFKMLINVIHPQ